MEEIKNRLRKFADERNWDQFHTPKNLVMALNGEIGELTEIFQWLDSDNSKLENLSDRDLARCKEEIADVFLYLVRLADKLEINLIKEGNNKIDINAEKYPIDLSKDNAIKYNQRDE
ncbi:nucleotide pyrophosphohydrolase [Flagellimonas olearia]|uniref:Nucleotide pyrophosphohydrolase n=1 Tax=Flagellimonas olearia TaxID=552546 RepID=A0A6I1DVZ8_9FLAO|nr:nucleotide pyrophosphohydrolase [Allomuricauda olearia]KAB7529268.1 nucleotide pyrophosphohydrolase [Allomuricauda olearia]